MIRCKFCMLRNSGESLNSTVALITSLTKSNRVFNLYLFTSAFLGKDYVIVVRFLRKGSTKTWNRESGNGNGITETETETNGNGIRNTESNINDRKLKYFTLHNLVQSKENLS